MLMLSIALAAASEPTFTREPTIGVLTYPVNSSATACTTSMSATPLCSALHTARIASATGRNASAVRGSYIDSSYKMWLEAAGARVVPIRYDLDEHSVRELFSKVNAVLFTGGPDKPLDAPKPYFARATLLYDLAVAAHIPLWGTCLGLQTIACIASGGKDVLGDFPVENFAYPLSFTPAAKASLMFGAASKSELLDFSQNVTTNWHHYGIAPSKLAGTGLVPLATNVALNGGTFVSALESEPPTGMDPAGTGGKGAGHQVFAVQFHPESVQWQVPSNGVPAKSAAALRSAQYLSRLLVERARANGHAFASSVEQSAALFENQGTFTPHDPHSLYPSDGVYTFSPAAVRAPPHTEAFPSAAASAAATSDARVR